MQDSQAVSQATKLLSTQPTALMLMASPLPLSYCLCCPFKIE